MKKLNLFLLIIIFISMFVVVSEKDEGVSDIKSEDGTSFSSSIKNNQNVKLGKKKFEDSGSDYLAGMIDELRIYDTELTGIQVCEGGAC